MTGELELCNSNGVELLSTVWKDDMLNLDFSEYSAGYEGTNITIKNLVIGDKYKVSFKFRSIGDYFWNNERWIKMLGYKISPEPIKDYTTYDDAYINLSKSEEFIEYNTEFVATSEVEYLVFNVAAFYDNSVNNFYIYDMNIY